MDEDPFETRTMETELFGRAVRFEYAEHWVGYALVGLRIGIGWILFQGGIEKLFDPGWTATGYLTEAVPAGNPFQGLWSALAGSPLVDGLVVWGLTLTGAGLVLGALTRWCSFWGTVMMLLFWMSSLEGGLLEGLPVAHGWVVDNHVVYAVLLFGLGAFGAGRIFGLDGRLERTRLVRTHPWLRVLLG